MKLLAYFTSLIAPIVFSAVLLHVAERMAGSGQGVGIAPLFLILFGPAMTWIEAAVGRVRYRRLADAHADLRDEHAELEERHLTLQKMTAAIAGTTSLDFSSAAKETPKP